MRQRSNRTYKPFVYVVDALKRNLLKLGIFFAISTSFVSMYILLFPTIQEQSKQLAQVIETFPKEFAESFNITGVETFSNIESFIGIEFFTITWPLIVIVLASSLASSAIAGEIDSRTLKFYLALPFSRSELYLAKYFAGLTQISLFVFFSLVVIKPLTMLMGTPISTLGILTLIALALLFALAVYSLGFLFSIAVSGKGLGIGLTAGLMALMYVMNILASLSDKVENLKYLLFFYYFDYLKALTEREISLNALLIYLSVIIISFGIGLTLFNKKDFSV